MSTANARTTSGEVGRPNGAHPGDDLTGSRPPYQAIVITRSYEGVVRQIAASIRSGRLSSGERLPTERELGVAFGVSRGVIREAIKVLGALGLVEARQGSGIYVLNTVPTVTRAFTLSVSPDAESIERLFEFRRTLEVDAAGFAALRRSDEGLAAIEASAEATAHALETDNWSEFGVADNAFHGAVARASGNPFFEVAVATARQMQQDVVPLIGDRAGSMRSAVAHHRAIVEAIAARDSDAAARAMADHIVYTARAVVMENISAPAPVVGDSPMPGEGPL
jgi:DNA-binding FadR family transcriptional regulator